jgi:hypothetical protein
MTPLTIVIGSKTQPVELTDSIAVTYSRFPGWSDTVRSLLVDVTTFAVEITPIWNPVLLKL